MSDPIVQGVETEPERNICSFVAPKKRRNGAHDRKSHGKDRKFKCEECDYAAVKKGALTAHVQNVHLKDSKCDLCSFVSSKSEVARHVKGVHDKVKEFVCEHCGYASTFRDTLNMHIKEVHSRIRDFKCGECEYATARKTELTRHAKTVHGDGARHFRCHRCEYTTTLRRYVMQHVRDVHEKRRMFKCERCEYSASVKNSVQCHFKAHHVAKECPRCDFTSESGMEMRLHVNSHTRKTRRKPPSPTRVFVSSCQTPAKATTSCDPELMNLLDPLKVEDVLTEDAKQKDEELLHSCLEPIAVCDEGDGIRGMISQYKNGTSKEEKEVTEIPYAINTEVGGGDQLLHPNVDDNAAVATVAVAVEEDDPTGFSIVKLEQDAY